MRVHNVIASLAFAVGLALAMIRERSSSLLPGIAFQLGGLVLATALGLALG